ncbi:DUF6461 domain-containing protein [Nonomuraea sp. NPDC004580]|uniref:DUF6461 domain-containing protein n=1 Tax=Nonomuraea sp. NPDC004580 TaxID=3154552 RepID=UPI0033B2DFDA
MPTDPVHAELVEIGGCVTYVRDLPFDEVVTRLGGHPDTFTPEPQWDYSTGSEAHVGIAKVGDWTVIVEWSTLLGISGSVMRRLSAGTRLVSHYCLDIKALDYFYWLDDGELRFCFIAQEGYMKPVPAELAAFMEDLETRYPNADPHKAPMWLLTEHLTGIKPWGRWA